MDGPDLQRSCIELSRMRREIRVTGVRQLHIELVDIPQDRTGNPTTTRPFSGRQPVIATTSPALPQPSLASLGARRVDRSGAPHAVI